MIGSNFFYKGVEIPYSTAQARVAGWLADLNWMTPAVRNSSVNKQGYHGVISNPTIAGGRLISVSGELFGFEKASRGAARNAIENLFQIEQELIQGAGFYKLEFTDDDGSEWFIWARVYRKPSYTHERAGVIAEFDLDLFAQDPVIRSKETNTESGIYGLYGGSTLPVTLPVQLNQAINSIDVENTGNWQSPPRITIKGDIINPRVINLTTGKSFGITATLSGLDELIIDSGLNKESGDDVLPTAELNGVNALANRMDGSAWIFINSGTNNIVLTGDNFDFDAQDKATIEIEYYNTKL